MNVPTVTICIRTFSGMWESKRYDRVEFFKRNMGSLFANTHIDHQIIIIDDASTMKTQHEALRLAAKAPHVQVIVKPKHLGRQHSFAMQRRLGLKSGSPYVYICDDDYEYQSGWLERMVRGYEALQTITPSMKIGLLSGFHRQGFKPSFVARFKSDDREAEFEIGNTSNWLGCRWLMAREVIKAGGYLDLAPEMEWPNNDEQELWTSPWIDDGSYQMQLTNDHGYAHAFVMMDTPSLVEHIGVRGVHSRPNKHVWGAK